MIGRDRESSEPLPGLDGSTMVVCCESFWPAFGGVGRLVERGQWRRLDDAVVVAHRENFAVRLSDLDLEAERR